MNERIRELYLHAFPPSLNDSTVCQMSAEKFAELIVRECIDLVAAGGEFASRPKLVENLQEHFGVEE
jgi:2,4-dienoyl-CoA reductase-like NADH-dependent reductase (Old Yellow Enzyme family)